MTGYALVSSVCLLQINSRPTPRLTESPFGPYSLDQSIVYIVVCLLSFGREQLNSKGIIFQGGSFRTVHGGYVCTRGIVPHVQIDPAGSIWIRYRLSKGGPNYMGNRLFSDTGRRRQFVGAATDFSWSARRR